MPIINTPTVPILRGTAPAADPQGPPATTAIRVNRYNMGSAVKPLLHTRRELHFAVTITNAHFGAAAVELPVQVFNLQEPTNYIVIGPSDLDNAVFVAIDSARITTNRYNAGTAAGLVIPHGCMVAPPGSGPREFLLPVRESRDLTICIVPTIPYDVTDPGYSDAGSIVVGYRPEAHEQLITALGAHQCGVGANE